MGEKSTRSRGRSGAADSAWGSAKLILLISNADVRNESAFRMKTVSRPKRAATTPPTAAPTSRFTDHVAQDNVLGTSPSSSAAMLGITALRAGSKNADMVVSASSRG